MGFTTTRLGAYALGIAIHTTHDPSDAEWAAALARLQTLRLEHGAHGMRVLVISDGGAPNAKQRNDLRIALADHAAHTAVITNALTNPFKRGIVTALTWVNPAFKTFTPDQPEDALRHLGLDAELPEVWRQCVALQKQMPRVKTLESMATSLGRPVPAAAHR